MSFANTTVRFPRTIRTRAVGVVSIQVIEKNTNATVTNGVSVDWVENDGVITINNISGLKKNTSYIVKLLVLGG